MRPPLPLPLATPTHVLAFSQLSAAADTPSPPLPRSLQYNDIGVEGAKAIAEGLKENTVLASLEYAHPPRP